MKNEEVSNYITHPYLVCCIGPFHFKDIWKDHSKRTFLFDEKRIWKSDKLGLKDMRTFNILLYHAN